jgi:hypothetical protein
VTDPIAYPGIGACEDNCTVPAPQDAGSKIVLDPIGAYASSNAGRLLSKIAVLSADLDEAMELLDEANAELDVDAFVGWCMRYDALVERRKGKACT